MGIIAVRIVLALQRHVRLKFFKTGFIRVYTPLAIS